MRRTAVRAAAAALLIGLVAAATTWIVHATVLSPKTVTAVFVAATAIYPGDDVRVSGVRIGTITAIVPMGTQTQITMSVDHDVPIPVDAKAVIVAQNLVSARYIQITPAYRNSGPVMPDKAVIPIDRTAVPVEWDEVKDQLSRLAMDLGPASNVATTSVGRLIDSAAGALHGNGATLRQMLAQLSGAGRILASGSGNIVDVIKNLQIFVDALRDSNTQIVQFEDRLATLTSVTDASRSELDAALRDLSDAVGEVKRFIAGSRDKTAEQLQRLTATTQVLVDHRTSLENVLHVAPNALANGYNVYNPDTGNARGAFGFTNFSNPVQFICGAIGAVENTTAPETAKLCAQYLGPGLRTLNMNYLPIPVNLYLGKSASPDNIIYSDPDLAPGGAGPSPTPPETPPAVSAYTGLDGDVPPPAGWEQIPPPVGITAPLPAAPTPALFPGAPAPTGPPTVQQMLIPTPAPPTPTPDATAQSPSPILPAEGKPSS